MYSLLIRFTVLENIKTLHLMLKYHLGYKL